MKLLIILTLFYIHIYASKEIYFKGNHIASDNEISTILDLKVPPLYRFWTWFDPYTVEEKQEAKIEATLKRYYRSLGYFLADIKVVSTDSRVYVYINESTQVKITKIYMDRYLGDYVKLKVGDLFDPEAFVQSKKDILRHYYETGYCHVLLNAKAYIDKDFLSAEIHYSVDDGVVCQIEDIEVEGIDKEKAKIILEHIELKNNQQFDINNIDRSYQLIQSYGAFSKVSIDYDRDNRDEINLKVPIVLSDNDYPRIVKFGVGISSDVGSKLFASWRHQDFLNEMKVLQFSIDLSAISQKIASTYIHRSFLPIHREWLNTLDYNQYMAFERKVFLNFSSDSYIFRPSLEKIEYVRELKFGLLMNQTKIKEEANKVGLSTLHQDSEDYFIVAPFFSLDYDYRDSKVRPTKGYYIQNYIEYGEPLLTSQVQYLKMVEKFSYIKSYNELITALTVNLGVIQEYFGKLPVSKYFYAGGSFSNRAYIFERLKTTDTQSLNGAKSLFEGSVNFIHQIYGNFDGMLFADGTILNEKELNYNSKMVFAIGAGVSYNTLVGPVNVSAGIDPNNINQYAVHFQVGYTF